MQSIETVKSKQNKQWEEVLMGGFFAKLMKKGMVNERRDEKVMNKYRLFHREIRMCRNLQQGGGASAIVAEKVS